MKILVTGANGMLAHALVPAFAARGHAVTALSRADLDVNDAAAIRSTLDAAQPDAVVQCAAYTRVDDAEREPETAMRVNALATRRLATVCRDIGARLVYPGTDYVFDGTAGAPYSPDAATAPLNAYGVSKLAGEVAAQVADALVVRTSWLYGRGGRNFVRTIVGRARAGAPLRVVDDQRGAPTGTRCLSDMIIALLEKGAPAGVYHATTTGDTSWFDFARAALALAHIDAEVTPVSSRDFPTTARRPAYSVLDCTRTYAITGAAPSWQDALADEIGAGLLDD